MVLEAIDVCKTYRHGPVAVSAVCGVSVSIAAGQTVAIMGPSGSGKSTLLHLLAGLDRPESGEVVIGGTRLSGLSDDGLTLLRRQKIGLVFQFFNLLPLLTARENVALPLLLAGESEAAPERRADELLAHVGMSARGEHKPDTLSGGELQRVAVARALSARPLALLADEPTGNLDSASGATVLSLLLGAARQSGSALVIVTHDERAADQTDRVLELRDGAIVGDLLRAKGTAGGGASSSEGEPACGI